MNRIKALYSFGIKIRIRICVNRPDKKKPVSINITGFEVASTRIELVSKV